tara:strand:- start:155 stop:289 length:135 start_codon:yes stop_codon:yes gene_type:complete
MGMSPSDFWSMRPIEFWWWMKAKNPEAFKEPQNLRLLRLLEEGF